MVTPKFQMIEVKIEATPLIALGSSVPFLDQDQLQTYVGGQVIFIKAIELFYDQEIPLSPMTTTNPVATNADVVLGTLVLVSKGRENFKYIPLTRLHAMKSDTGGNFLPYVFEMFQPGDLFAVDWTKTFIRFLGALTVQPMSFLFGIHYTYITMNAGEQ